MMNETVSKSVFLMQKSFRTLNLRRLKNSNIQIFFYIKLKFYLISVGKKSKKRQFGRRKLSTNTNFYLSI